LLKETSTAENKRQKRSVCVCVDKEGIGDYRGRQEERREGILSVGKLNKGSSL